MRNKTTEVTEGHREGVFGIVEYIPEEVAFVQVNYARLLSIVATWIISLGLASRPANPPQPSRPPAGSRDRSSPPSAHHASPG